MCIWVETERFYGFYSCSVCNSFSDTGQSPVNVNIVAPKLGALHTLHPPPQNGNLSKTALMILTEFRHLWRLILMCTCIGVIFRNIRVRTLGPKTRNVGFVRTGFTGRTDFTAVRYWAANSGLPSCSRFRFHDNVVNVVKWMCCLRSEFSDM
jgi:hypothetical protein